MIEMSKHFALAITCGAKRGPKDTDLIFSPASLRDFLKAIAEAEQYVVGNDTSQKRVDEMQKQRHDADPQPRQWVDLTDEEAMDAYCETPPFGTCKEAFIAGVRFIEAKLKEKNT